MPDLIRHLMRQWSTYAKDSGLFLDSSFFHLTKEGQAWRIMNFARPIY